MAANGPIICTRRCASAQAFVGICMRSGDCDGSASAADIVSRGVGGPRAATGTTVVSPVVQQAMRTVVRLTAAIMR